MVPAYLQRLDTIPLTISNKVDRRQLPAPTTRRVGRAGGYRPPEGDTERLLAEQLARILRVERVSVNDNFFEDLGADSLLMARYATLLAEIGLCRPAMRDIYQNPTIRQLAATVQPSASYPQAGATGDDTRSPPHASSAAYLLCGAAQLALFLAVDYLIAVLLTRAYDWLSTATDLPHALERATLFSVATFMGLTTIPILAKWALIGSWRPAHIPLWSASYFRFWLVKALVQLSLAALFAGSPLFTFYLRALGAKIGRNVTIFSRSIPVATDLISIGDGAVIRKDCAYSGYKAIDGVIQTGSIRLGRDTFVGHHTVLDIDTSMGDAATLGHSSTLNTGQAIPAGASWHGSPAEPTRTNYRTCPPMPGGALHKLVYSVLQLLLALFAGPALLALGVTLLARVPALVNFFSPGPPILSTSSFYIITVLFGAALFIVAILGGLVFVMVIPRLLNTPLHPERIYRLYGWHYILHQLVTLTTNSGFYMALFGDSSAVLHYVRALGYNLGRAVPGSNFGTELHHDTPYLTEIGRETMVSDGLSVMNGDYSGSSFRLRHVAVGEKNYVGNHVVYPPGARTGDNCLLATKVMVPIDGPVRHDTGLLGSPPFEIPRTVQRDSLLHNLKERGELRRRLSAKNRHNAGTAMLYLLVEGFQVLGLTVMTAIVVALYARCKELAVAAELVLIIPFHVGTMIIAERLVLGFRRLQPQQCSIYDRYFWKHERYWKHMLTPPFPGTPFRPLVLRLVGVRVGRRVFDDGCGIPEKTLVTIGDDAILNVGSVIQCHSLEDGAFKSDYTTIGGGATLGVHAFVHYGVTVGECAIVDANAFLMKGENVGDGAHWLGNPASLRRLPAASGHQGYAEVGALRVGTRPRPNRLVAPLAVASLLVLWLDPAAGQVPSSDPAATIRGLPVPVAGNDPHIHDAPLTDPQPDDPVQSEADTPTPAQLSGSPTTPHPPPRAPTAGATRRPSPRRTPPATRRPQAPPAPKPTPPPTATTGRPAARPAAPTTTR